MTYVFGALAAALVVIYMARPNFRRAILSAALAFVLAKGVATWVRER